MEGAACVGAIDEAPGAKTPPTCDVVAAEGTVGVEAITEARLLTLDETPPITEEAPAAPEEELPLLPEAAPQLEPVGSFNVALDATCTTEPGLGNLVSKFCGLVHEASGMLATNMSGKESKAELSDAPPVTVIGAQF